MGHPGFLYEFILHPAGDILFSKRITELEPSSTIALNNLVKRMEREGKKVLSFTLGEPDFPTPPHIVEAAKTALDNGDTHYTPSAGTMQLRQAVVDRVRTVNSLKVQPENVIILPTKLAIYMAVQAFVDDGDEIIFPDPGWVSYGPMVQLSGGRPVPVPMVNEDGWKWELPEIEKAITKRTKAIIINTPSNPTGSILSRKDQEGLAKLARDHGLKIISDEIYENLVYDEPHHSIGSLPAAEDNTITISGLSKSYAMTGWRVGWMVADPNTIEMVNKLQQHTLTCLPGFVQAGAVAALKGGDSTVEPMRREFKARRDLVIPLLNEIDDITCEVPKGAFYAFFRMDNGKSSTENAELLLKHAQVALTPGSAFGKAGEGYQRMSYAASRDDLKAGIAKIRSFMKGSQ